MSPKIPRPGPGVTGVASKYPLAIRSSWRRTRSWTIAGGLTAASLALAVWVGPVWVQRRSAVDRTISELVGAVGSNRFTLARLGEPFAWGPAPSALRDTDPSSLSIAVQEAGLKLRRLAERERSAPALRGLGIALLAQGNTDGAVAALEEAVRLSPDAISTRVDLSAALIERWRRSQEAAHAVHALDEVERARQLQPRRADVLFNRGLVIEAVAMRFEARRA